MSYNRVYKLIDNFVSLAQQTGGQPSIDEQYQQQRDMLESFGDDFKRKLRAIISELGGEFIVLKERQFDPKMLKMLAKVHKELIEIMITIDDNKPYEAATKFVHYVLSRPTASIIDNLNFLAKHHLKITNVDFAAGKHLVHPEMRSLDKLKALAIQLKHFIAKHPLLTPIVPAELPPARPVVEDPVRPSTPEQELGTKPGTPEARERQE